MDHIRISSTDYSLEFVDRLVSDDRTSLNGWILYDKTAIRVDTALLPQKRYQTIWHEVVHGICNHASVDISEENVDRIAQGICQVLRDNAEVLLKKFFPWGKNK